MVISVKRLAGLAGAAAVAFVLHAGPATAEKLTYCGGSLEIRETYRTMGSAGSLEYRARLLNADRPRRTIKVSASVPPMVGGLKTLSYLTQIQTLGWFKANEVLVFSVKPNQPSGTDAPSAVDGIRAIQFTCTFG